MMLFVTNFITIHSTNNNFFSLFADVLSIVIQVSSIHHLLKEEMEEKLENVLNGAVLFCAFHIKMKEGGITFSLR